MWIKLETGVNGHRLIIAQSDRLANKVEITFEALEPVIRADGVEHRAWKILRGGSESVFEYPKTSPIKVLAVRFEEGLWVKVCS